MRFMCPKCETAFEVPDDHPGDVVPCEQCQASLSIHPGEPELLDRPVPGPSRYRSRGGGRDPRAVLQSMIATVDEFWAESHEAWISGRIRAVIPKAEEAAAAVDIPAFAAQFVEKRYKALYFLLREFGPLDGEFYCGGDEKDCAVTNLRLVTRDPRSRTYQVVPLALLTGRVDEKGWWTKTATYHLKSGKTLTFAKLGSFIPEKNIKAIQSLEDCYTLGGDLLALAGNVEP